MSEAGPRVNGPASPTGKYIDGIDPDDPEYIKNLQRPAEVKEDLQQMENRSRVSLVLSSQAFKEELEQVVEEQLRSGPYPASLIALQQITDLLLPHSKGSLGSLARAATVIPINDLRGVESLGFAKGEKLLRCKLAALYRIIDLCGWSHGIYNHISARVSPDHEHFLLNPFGMLYSEITASSLIKVDVRGEIVEPGSTQFGVSKAGFTLHSAIHQARPDIKCIVHLHTPAAVAVSAMKCGLLPMSQEALICGKLSYHDYQGIFVNPEEREKLARNLGVHNKILVLRNHGIVACGETIEEAFHFTFNVMAACEAQVKAVPAGLDNIVIPSEEAREQAFKTANQGGGGVESTGRKWKLGELEFEALMRTLDNSGYRTGYVYKIPFVKQEKKERSNSEVEIPPASSSFTYVFDGDIEHSKYASPIKAAMERQKKAYKAGWLTTPNAYKKTEVEEIGTITPKKITKWVSEGESPNRPSGTPPIKIENPNQFAPQGDNPKEFKLKQKSIRKDYYEEKVTPGPQSKILEGISWDEAQKVKDGLLSGAGDQLIVVGAASKGIIQRDHQHNAVVYRQYYAANPFENMSEAEIEQYQAEVQRREKGEPVSEIVTESANVMITSQQPTHVEQPQPESSHEVEPVPETRKEAEAIKSNQSIEELNRTTRSPPDPQQPRKDKALTQLADTVVQTVISDALSVLRRGKGQQILTGTEPLHQHSYSSQHSMGSQILNNSSTKNISSTYSDKKSNHTCYGDTMKQSHRSGQSRCDNVGGKHKKYSLDTREDAAGAATEDLRWFASGASNPEDDYLTINLDPIQLYHGQASEGTMKVKFTIHSTVRRQVRADIGRGSIIDGIYSSVSEPLVEVAGSSSHNETSGLQNDYSDEAIARNTDRGKKHRYTAETGTTASRMAPPDSSTFNKCEEKSNAECSLISELSHSGTLISSHERGFKVQGSNEENIQISDLQHGVIFSLSNGVEDNLMNEDERTNEYDQNNQLTSQVTKTRVKKKRLKYKCPIDNPISPLKEEFSVDVTGNKKHNIDKEDDSFENILHLHENIIIDKSHLCEELNLNEFTGAASLDDIEDVDASSLKMHSEKNKTLSVTCYVDKEQISLYNEDGMWGSQFGTPSESLITMTKEDCETKFSEILEENIMKHENTTELAVEENKEKQTDNLDLVTNSLFSKDLKFVHEKDDFLKDCENILIRNKSVALDNGSHILNEVSNEIQNEGFSSLKCVENQEMLINDILAVNIKENNTVEKCSKHLIHLNEGPLQTSSPKLGRSKSKDSPFKTYPQKLGKSEETLLDIMPLNSHKVRVVAKSQEELEDNKDENNIKGPLLRTVSLGPHHKKKRNKSITRIKNAASKETVIDDYPVAGIADKGNLAPTKFVLDRYNLMIHNELMKLSNCASFYKPPEIVAYPLMSSSMPPLPDTTEVPSVSDTEGHHRVAASLNHPPRIIPTAARSNSHPSGPVDSLPKQGKSRHHSEHPEETGDNAIKRRWTPKQKRDRRVVSEQIDNERKSERTLVSVSEEIHVSQLDREVDKSDGNRKQRQSSREERKHDRSQEKDNFTRQNNIDESEGRISCEIKRDKREQPNTEGKRNAETDQRRSEKIKKESLEVLTKPPAEVKGRLFVKQRESFDVIRHEEQDKLLRGKGLLEQKENQLKTDLEKDGQNIKKKSVTETDIDDEINKPIMVRGVETELIDHLSIKHKGKSPKETEIQSERENKIVKSNQQFDVEESKLKNYKKFVSEEDSQLNIKKEHLEKSKEIDELPSGKKEAEVVSKKKSSYDRNRKNDSIDLNEEKDQEWRKSYERSRRNDGEIYEDNRQEDLNKRQRYDKFRRNDDGDVLEEMRPDDDSKKSNERSRRDDRYSRYRRNDGEDKCEDQRFEEVNDRRKISDRSRRYDEDKYENRQDDDYDRRRSYDRSRRNDEGKYGDKRLEDDYDRKRNSDRLRRYDKDDDRRRSYDKSSRYDDEGDKRREDDHERRKKISDRSRRYDDEDKYEKKQDKDYDRRKSYDRSRRKDDTKEIVDLERQKDQRWSYNQYIKKDDFSFKSKEQGNIDENDNMYKKYRHDGKSNDDTTHISDTTSKYENDKELMYHFDRGRKKDTLEIGESVRPPEKRERFRKESSKREVENDTSIGKDKADDKSALKTNFNFEVDNKKGDNKKYAGEEIKTKTDKLHISSTSKSKGSSDEDIPPVPPRLQSLEVDDSFVNLPDSVTEKPKSPIINTFKSRQAIPTKTDEFYERSGELEIPLQDKEKKTTTDRKHERRAEPRRKRSYLEDDSDNRIRSTKLEPPSKDFEGQPENKIMLPLGSPQEFIVEKRDHKELEPYMYARGRRSGRIPKRLDISREETPDSDSDNKKTDLDTLLPDNPIELNIDENLDKKDSIQVEETPTKKGIFNLFSCVGGKSSDILKKKPKEKKPIKKYYDEGEKRKIKKLTKEKDREEKNRLYFQDPDEVLAENAPISLPETEVEPLESLNNFAPELPEVPDPTLKISSRKYQRKPMLLEVSKPLPFLDPDSVFEDVLGSADNFEEVDDVPLGTFTRWNENKVEEPKLSSFMSAKREEKQFNKRNFRRHYEQNIATIQKNVSDLVDNDFSEDHKDDSSITAASRSSSSFIKMNSSNEEPIKLKGGCPDMQHLGIYDDSLDSNLQNYETNQMLEKPGRINLCSKTQAFEEQIPIVDLEKKMSDIINTCIEGDMQQLLIDQNTVNSPLLLNSVEIKLEPPTPESTFEDIFDQCHDENLQEESKCTEKLSVLSSYNDLAHDDDHVLNLSAPSFFTVGVVEGEKLNLDASHDLNNSFDPSASFEADMLYRRKHRTVSFDERLTSDRLLSPSLARKNSSSLIAEPVTRPRSSSTTSNPLTYEPWRAKAYNKQHSHKSLSASGLLHGRSGTRLHKSHSIGEIYNSTVASSVARRRAKTLVSSDITSRMYQPRQRSRSRALLGDASFGSVAPIRQRSFSGFDYATSASSVEPSTVTVKRSESERQPSKIQIVEKEESKNVERSKSDRRLKNKEIGDAKPASPSKSDTLRSTDSASGGETLEDRSSKEGSPTKEHPSPTKEKKKKKKFRIPSFSKKKSKENKESAI